MPKVKNEYRKILNWNVSHAVIMLFASASGLLFNNVLILILPAFISFIGFGVQHLHFLKSLQPLGGVANRITFFSLSAYFGYCNLQRINSLSNTFCAF